MMKILSLERNDFGQLIAHVLNCGKTLKISARDLSDLPKNISKACHFVTPEDVRVDLDLNFNERIT